MGRIWWLTEYLEQITTWVQSIYGCLHLVPLIFKDLVKQKQHFTCLSNRHETYRLTFSVTTAAIFWNSIPMRDKGKGYNIMYNTVHYTKTNIFTYNRIIFWPKVTFVLKEFKKYQHYFVLCCFVANTIIIFLLSIHKLKQCSCDGELTLQSLTTIDKTQDTE